jgi:hypothetical protein
VNPQIQVISIAGSLVVMGLVFQLIRQRQLREEYAILWFVASLLLIGVAVWRDSLEIVASLTGVAYPPSVLLLGVIIVGFLLAIHYSISLSCLADQNKRLAQEIALLRHHLETSGEPDGGRVGEKA